MKSKITEQPSRYDHLEQMAVGELLQHINDEDALVAEAVRQSLPQIEALVEAIEARMKQGGRLFYIGAGTSGRLGVLDASELPPTFGVSADKVIGIIAGGDRALRHAVEGAEDVAGQGWQDLLPYHPTKADTLLGIAASGTTPYVVDAVRQARQSGLLTGCITSNPDTPLAQAAECPIEIIVGPEFVTGSSRMKSGTAQKMVLNMISTTLMIRMGRVEGNRMVNMQLTNDKLIDRGTRMLQESLGLDYAAAQQRLLDAGSVASALRDNVQPEGSCPAVSPTSAVSSSPAATGYETYIFDLDGTLLDTLGDLAASVNHALQTYHMPQHSLDAVRKMVGNGVRLLMERAVPGGAQHPLFEAVFATFRQYYMEHSLDTTRPYDGIISLLQALKAQGKRTAVVSNKFDAATKSLCHHFFSSLIDVAVGEHEAEGIRKKPAPDTVRQALSQLGVSAEGAVYIGDSEVDVATACNSGLPCISVLWGFRSREFLQAHGATTFISTPQELLPLSSLPAAEARIRQMELRLERAAAAVKTLSAALEDYEAVQDDIAALEKYYVSEEWKQDYAADEAGLLPDGLKRGVLSEDGLWDLLTEARELSKRVSDENTCEDSAGVDAKTAG